MSGPTPFETLAGETPLTVRHLDGATEQVAVRCVQIREFPRLVDVQDDEPRLAEFYASRPQGWADTLTRESHEAIVTEGDRLNSDFFGRWLQRRLGRLAAINPGLADSLAPSPTSPPKAD